MTSESLSWMKRALGIALKGKSSVSPNPMVGCCIVKNNRLIAQGYHRIYGGPHAEIEALNAAGKKAQGATLYVTLEPCSSWGKTPPCVAAILRSGIRKVVVALLDPNPKHQGAGIKALRKAGVEVVSGIMQKEALEQNRAFLKRVTTGLPFVTLKMAQTLDGKIATKNGSSRWVSGPESRHYVHQLRGDHDAVMVGKGTFQKDNPRLSPQTKKKGLWGKPWRIAIAADPRISSRARIWEGDQLTFLAIPENKTRFFSKAVSKQKNAVLLPVVFAENKIDMGDLLKKLGALGVGTLLVEGGGETAWSLLSGGWVDRFLWIIAPKFFGGRDAKTSVEGPGVALPQEAFMCDLLSIKRIGEDILIEGSPRCLRVSSKA